MTFDCDRTLTFWDLASGRRVWTLTAPCDPHAGGLVISPDGSRLALFCKETVWTVRGAEGEVLKPLGNFEGSNHVEYSLHGEYLASTYWFRPGPTLWDVESAQPRDAKGLGHKGGALVVAFSRDGRTLASGGKDRTIILWDSRSLEEFARLSDHTDEVRSLAFSPDRKTLASGAKDRTVRLWDIASRRGIAILTGHSGSVESLRFSPDGSILASTAEGRDGRAEVFLWPVSLEGSEKSPLSLHP